MSLLNLKRQLPQAEKPRQSVDEFIHGAMLYAVGYNDIQQQNEQNHIENGAPGCCSLTFKKATYSMTLDTLDALNIMSNHSDISRSRILRILVNDIYATDYIDRLTSSLTK